MFIPLKNHSVAELEKAIAEAVKNLTGREHRVQVDAVEFAQDEDHAVLRVVVWDKASTGMYPGAL